MKKFFKKAIVVLLAAAVTASFSACGSKGQTDTSKNASNGPIVIKYPSFQIGVNSYAPVFSKNIEEFNKKYGDKIKVEVEEIPGDQAYVDKMKVLLSANELPDLVYAGGYNLLDPALEKNAVVDLTPYLNDDPEWKALFNKDVLDFNSRDGKVYSLPNERQVIGYFYNRELFSKAGINAPPETWDEFFKDCDKLKAVGITPISMDTADSGWLTSLWMNSMVGTNGDNGNKLMNTSNITDYTAPEFIDAFTKIQKMFKEYTTTDAIGGKYENGANNFLSGKTAMIANGPWMISDFEDTTKAPAGFVNKVGAAIFPGQGVFDAPMLGFFVASKDKEHADATVTLLKYLTSKEVQLRGFDMIGTMPVSTNIEIPQDIAKKHPLVAELISLANGAKYKYNNYQGLWYPNTLDELSTDYPALATGKMTPEEFANKLTEVANKNK